LGNPFDAAPGARFGELPQAKDDRPRLWWLTPSGPPGAGRTGAAVRCCRGVRERKRFALSKAKFFTFRW